MWAVLLQVLPLALKLVGMGIDKGVQKNILKQDARRDFLQLLKTLNPILVNSARAKKSIEAQILRARKQINESDHPES